VSEIAESAELVILEICAMKEVMNTVFKFDLGKVLMMSAM